MARANDLGVAPAPAPDPEAEQWSRVEQLLAAVRDELHFFRHHYVSLHSGKQKPKWAPEPLARPGVSSSGPARKHINSDQVDRLWAHLQSTQAET